jgi:hypothetical protein
VAMRRASLLTLAALGLVVCLVGSTGLFAALTDTARTGTNQVTTPGLASSADIVVASTIDSAGSLACGTYSDDLATGLIDFTASPPYANADSFLCVKNVGSQALSSLTVQADELTDVDTACTGDEEANGDATCGGDAAGELADVLDVTVGWDACPYQMWTDTSPTTTLLASSTTPITLPTLAVGEEVCFLLRVAYPTAGASPEAIQRAQSDTVTWRFRFDAGT